MAAKKRKGAVSPRVLVLGGLALVLAVLAYMFFFGGGEKVKRFVDANIPKPPGSAAPASASAATRPVTLYFVSEDDDSLHKEAREIAAGPTDADEAERALAELVKGSEKGFLSPLPPKTRVRQVFIARDGLATVDFSRDIADSFSYGSSSELAAVYAVVDTLVTNFKSVKKVVILVEGAERDTLGGHVDLSRAFYADYTLVAK